VPKELRNGYHGFGDARKRVQVRKRVGQFEAPLPCRWDMASHSPDGFKWEVD
jgi:hypothetical protein